MSKKDDIHKPPIKISKDLTERYVKLYKGIRSTTDPITWRSLIVESKVMLGSKDPENRSLSGSKFVKAYKFINFLLKDTFLDLLVPEVLTAMGFEKFVDEENDKLDALLLNAHHTSEPLLWALAAKYKKEGKKVAVVNPVGHYSDRQIRILSIGKLLRHVKKVIIVSSTQYIYGGSITVLSNTIRTLRNINIATKVDEVDVLFPMFGGSRGHRSGQMDEIGYEVLEAVFNSKILALTTKDLKKKLKEQIGELTPKFRFYSVDVHSEKSPQEVFSQEGFHFKSISPAPDFAHEIHKLTKEKSLSKYPIRLISCDMGAIARTEHLAKELLNSSRSGVKELDVVYIRKVRQGAGVVKEVKVEKVIRWKKTKEKLVKTDLKNGADNGKYILVYTDDMMDTGGTATKDISFLGSLYPNAKLKIFAATHPILSKGADVLESIGADYYLLGNTLNPPHLDEHKQAIICDLANSCYAEIEK